MLTLSVNNAPCSHLEKTLTWHCWLKSKQKQSCLSHILTRTWIHWLNSQAKNHATSSFAHKLATFTSSWPLATRIFYPLRTVKNYPLFSGLKTPQSNQKFLVISQKKTPTLSGSCPYVSFPSTLLKIILFTTVKTNIQKHCTVTVSSQTRKKRHFRPTRRAVFPLHTLSKNL